MTVLDFGCAMGFFSLPMAEMVGPEGEVVCVDLQERMLSTLTRRAAKAGLMNRIRTHACKAESIGLPDMNGKIDFAAALHVLHEVPNIPDILKEICALLRPEGRLLIAEPKFRVSMEKFEETVSAAKNAGFEPIHRPDMGRSLAVLLKK